MRCRLFFVAAALSCLAFVSCGTTKPLGNSFYERNVGDFSERVLGNGIPVVVKKNAGSRIDVVRVVFEGGVPLVPRSLSGVEELTVDLMVHGSSKYPYQQIQKMCYDRSFAVTSSSGKDFSSVSLTCIHRDLSDALDILADGILNPLFSGKDFAQALTLAEDSLQSRKASPEGALGIAVSEGIFAGHPYSSTVSVNDESVSRLKLDDVKSHHRKLLDSSRMSIVVVGNLSDGEIDDLVGKLEGYFGSIENGGYVRPEIPQVGIQGGNIIVPCAAAGEVGYIEGMFRCPERDSPDYIPYVLATMFLDDSLFDVVRERNGAVYSVGSGVVGARRLLGAVSLYKATKAEGLGGMVREAISAFPKSEKEIKARLDMYKNKYITSIFENSRSAGGIASNIISSMMYRSSPSEYLLRPSQVRAVSPSDVMAAYRKYIEPLSREDAEIRWVVVSGAGSAEKFEL